MDTSETYIKMCEKAEEIQNHSFDEGDYHGLLQNGYWSAHNYCVEDGFVGVNPLKVFWLPRQDQLQEMVGDLARKDWGANEFEAEVQFFAIEVIFSNDSGIFGLHTGYEQFQSWEQLWLAFVMKEKYGKVWTGEEWKWLKQEVALVK